MTAPLNGMTGPETSAAEQSRMELQAKLNGLGGLNGRRLDPEARAKKLREACEGFESIFIQKMWQEMRNAVPKTGLLSGREERFWQDMYDQELAKSMTRAGGIGLADMMYEQLSRNLVSASRSAAGVAQGAAFAPTAAPLVPEAESVPAGLEGRLAASIYDGEAAETGAIAEAPAKAEPARPAATEPVQAAAQAQPEAARAVEPAAAPLTAPAGQAMAEAASEPKPHKHIHKADLGQSSGLLMAQKAKRDAGDKLGSRAVRPAQRQNRRQQQEAAQAPQAAPVQTGEARPGSPEALRAAMEMAKSGAAPADNAAQPVNLRNLVANVQAMNATAGQAASAQDAGAGQTETQTADAAEPVTRKVRFTTNVPKKSALSNNKTKQAIRMLNVDNVGVNSKQGQGLEAWHAQQEATKAAEAQTAQSRPVQPRQPVPPLTAEPQNAPIPPLTPQNRSAEAETSFPIPPLTIADSRR